MRFTVKSKRTSPYVFLIKFRGDPIPLEGFGDEAGSVTSSKRVDNKLARYSMVLTRFRGHLNLIRGGVHDAKNKKALCT